MFNLLYTFTRILCWPVPMFLTNLVYEMSEWLLKRVQATFFWSPFHISYCIVLIERGLNLWFLHSFFCGRNLTIKNDEFFKRISANSKLWIRAKYDELRYCKNINIFFIFFIIFFRTRQIFIFKVNHRRKYQRIHFCAQESPARSRSRDAILIMSEMNLPPLLSTCFIIEKIYQRKL